MFTRNTDKIRVAYAGDSITEGTDYPAYLAGLLGSNYTVGNFGVGGPQHLQILGDPTLTKLHFKTQRSSSLAE